MRKKKSTHPKPRISVGDWVSVSTGDLRGASGQVRKMDNKIATLRQLNGNEINVPITRLKFSEYDSAHADGLQ